MSSLFAFMHHIAAFALVAALAVELVLLRDGFTLADARKIQAADRIYGISAGIVLAVGLMRVFYFEKGADYYLHSVPFIAKVTLFAVVGLLSVYPTIEFIKWQKPVRAGTLPPVDAGRLRLLRRIVHTELVGIMLLILCAALMARGIGSSW